MYRTSRHATRIQAPREGGLSERARRRAVELADDAEKRLTVPRPQDPVPGRVITVSFPKPGWVLRHEYNRRVIVVRVLPRKFEYEVYRSLASIARKVTGAGAQQCID